LEDAPEDADHVGEDDPTNDPQLCAARERPELADLELADSTTFYYTNQGENPDIDNVDDDAEFVQTHESLRLLGFNDTNCKSMYKIMVGVRLL
jgi:myosin-5